MNNHNTENDKDTAAINAYYNEGNAAIERGQMPEARVAFNNGIEESAKRRDNLSEGIGLANMAFFYNSSGRYDSATIAATRALALFKKEHYKGHMYLVARLSMLEHYELNSDHLNLTRDGLAILKEAKEAKDTPAMARTLSLLSRAGTEIVDDNKSIAYLEEAVALLRHASDKSSLPKTLNNLGSSYTTAGRFEEAIKVCHEALQHNTPDVRVDGYTYCYLASAHLGLNQTDSALFYLDKSKAIAAKFNDPRMMLNIYSAYADAYSAQGAYEKTIAELDSGIALMKKEGINAVMPGFMIARAMAFRKLGNYKEALYAYGDADRMLADLKEEEVRKKIAELETKYQTHEKETSIRLLSRTAVLTRNWLLLVLGVLVVTLSLGILTLVQYRRQKRANKLITSQAEKLQWLMKEIHHRVKNNLQVISSLIRMQLRKQKDPDAERLLTDTMSRIQSIAIIHEKLYKNNEQETVVLKDYIQLLSKAILSVNGHALLRIETDILLDIDTAVLLGLVLTELITNSCKYARVADRELELSIVIETNANGYKLMYRDNGPGLQEEKNVQQTMGMQIISLMTRQMGGNIDCVNDNGICCIIHFKDEAQRKLEA